MTDYGRYERKAIEVKPTINEAKERRKKVLDAVRKRRAIILRRQKG